MIETTTMQVHEEQVMNLANQVKNPAIVPLTKTNAHRVTLIRKKETDDIPIPFHFRKRSMGMNTYIHTYGENGKEEELYPADFQYWEVVEFKHPGYLESLWEQALHAYYWNSQDPEVRAETDIMHYEMQLHEDLKKIPEDKQPNYIETYRQKFSGLLNSLSKCANPMVTGRSNFNYQRNEKANNTYQNKYEEFHQWRKRYMDAMQQMMEAAKPEEEKLEETWSKLKRDIASSANTIHEIDTGKARGYHRALFVSSILNKVSTFANHGEVEIVQKAVDFITEYNAKVKKPVITSRNKFFQLPEIAKRMKEKLQAIREQENKEMKFEGGTLVWNYEEDRLQILFNDIPHENTRKDLKSSGFRWSPRFHAWQRQLTSNAIYAAKRILNLSNL